MGPTKGVSQVTAPEITSLTPSIQTGGIGLDKGLKDEAARKKRANYIVAGISGTSVIGVGGLLGGSAAGGVLFAFSGAAVIASSVATAGLAVLIIAVAIGVFVAYRINRKSKKQENLSDRKQSALEPDTRYGEGLKPRNALLPQKFPLSDEDLIKHQRLEDTRAIYQALGVSGDITQEIEENFKKEHKRDIHEVADTVGRAVANVRFKNKTVVYGGLGLGGSEGHRWVGKGKWKYLVELDPSDQQIKRLFIAKQVAAGGFTKVSLGLSGRIALLLPKNLLKNEGKRDLKLSEKEQVRAEKNIKHLHDHFKADTTKSYDVVKNLLPPMPEKIGSKKLDGTKRTLWLAPEATAVEKLFATAPKQDEVKEIIKRLTVLRDVALGVGLVHEAGMIHGDLKPQNMLLSLDPHGRAHPHDFGGARIIDKDGDKSVEGNKLIEISHTPRYTHVKDGNHIVDYVESNSSDLKNNDDLIQLGRSMDVFALGVSTIKALIGMDNPPFRKDAYQKDHYIEGKPEMRSNIDCIPENSPAGIKLHALLNKALSEDYRNRGSAIEYAKSLDEVIAELEKTLPQG